MSEFNQFANEKEYILNAFYKNFAKFAQKKIVIYGLGQNTKIILESYSHFNIIGLMDESRAGEIVFGKTVFCLDELVKQKTQVVIIVARAANVPIIHRRIERLCKDNNIAVYDINGFIVESNINGKNLQDEYGGITTESLKNKIDNSDVVSFDMFDTLVMRDVLYNRDIYSIIEKDIGDGFANDRAKIEDLLSLNNGCPNIYNFYETLHGLEPNYEIELEKKHLIRREEMCLMYDYAKSKGKDIYIVSDMYLNADILKEILDSLNITIPITNIIVSSDHRLTKRNGLFKVLKEKVECKRILHIGDNHSADILAAREYGIEDVFYIKSSLEMLQDSPLSNLLQYDKTLEDRMILGRFISKQFNNPFHFSENNFNIKINSTFELGYNYVAPILYAFYSWMLESAKRLNLSDILLSARDGYIINRIYLMLKDKVEDMPMMHYLYISRQIAIICSIFSEQDILYVANLAFSGDTKELLEKRFYLEKCKILTRKSSLSDEEYILLHKEEILKKASDLRYRYTLYFKSIGINMDERIGFMDYVSRGTTQNALNKFMDIDLIGLYFAYYTTDENKCDLQIESMYGQLNIYSSKFEIIKNYFIFENLLSSYEPSMYSLGEDMTVVFERENRSVDHLKDLEELHTGVLDYIYSPPLNICDMRRVSIELMDFISNGISQDYIDTKSIRCMGAVVDDFTNRKFELSKKDIIGINQS